MRKLVLILSLVGIGACGGTDAAKCPNLTGAWKITSHCQTDLVGQTFGVTKKTLECQFEPSAPFEGFTLTTDTTNAVALQAGGGLQCMGSLVDKNVVLTCTPECDVTIQKQ